MTKQQTKDHPIRIKDLAALISEKSNGAYFNYEIHDFLELFSDTIRELTLEGQEVNINNFGIFKPKYTKSRKGFSGLKGGYIDIEGGVSLQFTPSRNFQKSLRKEFFERKKGK